MWEVIVFTAGRRVGQCLRAEPGTLSFVGRGRDGLASETFAGSGKGIGWGRVGQLMGRGVVAPVLLGGEGVEGCEGGGGLRGAGVGKSGGGGRCL